MMRFGASVDFEPVVSTVVYIAVQTNVARNAFRDASTMPQYMTVVGPNFLWNSLFVCEAWNREAKKNGRSHCFRAQYVVGSHSCRVFSALKQVGAHEGNCRQIETGWVLERSKTTCEASGEECL